jgi:hypothetical protein
MGWTPACVPAFTPSPPPGPASRPCEGPPGPAADYQSAETPAVAAGLARPGPAPGPGVALQPQDRPHAPYRGACWRPHAEQPPELRDPKSGLSPTHSPPVLPAGPTRGQSRERAEGLLLRCVFRGYGVGGGGSGGCSDYEISTGFAKQASGDGGLVCTPAEGG